MMSEKKYSAEELLARIVSASEAIAGQAGVGGMETAGSIVSYLAEHPEALPGFMAGESIMDWPVSWHAHGRLTWHGANGEIVSPEFFRRHQTIRSLERPLP